MLWCCQSFSFLLLFCFFFDSMYRKLRILRFVAPFLLRNCANSLHIIYLFILFLFFHYQIDFHKAYIHSSSPIANSQPTFLLSMSNTWSLYFILKKTLHLLQWPHVSFTTFEIWFLAIKSIWYSFHRNWDQIYVIISRASQFWYTYC